MWIKQQEIKVLQDVLTRKGYLPPEYSLCKINPPDHDEQ
jgi:hypothetical protein